MAENKFISELSKATELKNEAQFVIEQDGQNKSVTGEQLKDFIDESITDTSDVELRYNISDNIINKDYTPIPPYDSIELYKGGMDKLIRSTGLVSNTVGWITSQLIDWQDNTELILNGYKSYIQYDKDYNVLEVVYSASSTLVTPINRYENAKYIKISDVYDRTTPWHGNFGNVLLDYTPFKEYSTVINKITGVVISGNENSSTDKEKVVQWALSESYGVQNATYTDGKLNADTEIKYPDGEVGNITITYNVNGEATKIDAIYKGNTYSITITRDAQDNVINVEF